LLRHDLQFAGDQIERDLVVSAFRNNQISDSFGGLDELEVHRPNRPVVLIPNRFEGAAPLLDVATNPPKNADVGVGIDEQLHVEEIAQRLLDEDEDALDDDDRCRLHFAGFFGTAVVFEIVDGDGDGLAGPQRYEVLDEQRRLERCRMVEVDAGSFGFRKRREVAVVRIVLDNRDGLLGEACRNFPRDGGLSRPGPARDPDEQNAHGPRDVACPASSGVAVSVAMSAKVARAAVPRGITGVVHLPALPGDPAHRGESLNDIEAFAVRDAEALHRGGVSGLIVENFGSAPFSKGSAGHRLPPHQIAAMTLLVHAIQKATGGNLPIGVNCLRNDAFAALGIAAMTGSAFVRVNVHVGAYVTDQGLIEGEADQSLRYRKSLGADGIGLFADILVKHAAPLVPLGAGQATHDVLLRGLADAVIVTGERTGAPASPETLAEVRDAADGAPVLVGSGVDLDTVKTIARLAHGAIVGTALKVDGALHAPVDQERVRRLVDAWGSVA
jgi:uncharacterized protein